MSKDFRHGQAQLLKSSKRKGFTEPIPRVLKTFNEHRIRGVLQRAVRSQDRDILDDYDEIDLMTRDDSYTD